jgi:hypothetical protein
MTYDKNQKLEFLRSQGFEDWQLSGTSEEVLDGWIAIFSEPGHTIEEFFDDPIPEDPFKEARQDHYASMGVVD